MPIVLDRKTMLREVLNLAWICDEFPSWELEPFGQYLSFGGRQLLLSIRKSSTEGDMFSCYCIYQPQDTFVRILSFGTHPRFRKRGLARHIISQLDESGKRLVAYVPCENIDAARFLIAIGFVPSGEIIVDKEALLRYSRQPRKA